MPPLEGRFGATSCRSNRQDRGKRDWVGLVVELRRRVEFAVDQRSVCCLRCVARRQFSSCGRRQANRQSHVCDRHRDRREPGRRARYLVTRLLARSSSRSAGKKGIKKKEQLSPVMDGPSVPRAVFRAW
jgi:hypothetical protein